MDSNRLQYLFICYRNSSCTKKELEELNLWYNHLRIGDYQIEDWIAKAGGEEPLADQLFQNFCKKPTGYKN